MINLRWGFVLYIKKIGESDALIKIISDSGSIVSGLVKSFDSKKNIGIYQVSNLISFSWVGREGSLGNIKASCVRSYLSLFLSGKLTTFCINSACALIYLLIKSDGHNNVYDAMFDFLEFLRTKEPSDSEVIEKYLNFERMLIFETGDVPQDINNFKDFKNNNYELLQNIFLGYNTKMPVCRSLLQNAICGNFI